MRVWSSILALLMVMLTSVAGALPASAQSHWKPGLEASRYILSYGRIDGIRLEGIAGIMPDERPDKFYRNIPGITGPGGFFDVISRVPRPFTPPLVSFDMDAAGIQDGILDGRDLLIVAGQFLPPGFSLLVLENAPPRATAWKWEGFVRFGEGNFYATTAIPGTDIVAGTELYTKEHFRAYTANSILWEAPDQGDVVVDTELDGGTINIEANGSVRQLGYADPMNLDIVIRSQRFMPDGSCRATLEGRLMNSFGNPVAPGIPAGYSWFRWAFEHNGTEIITVPGTPFVTVDLPAGGGPTGGNQVAISLVASSFGPGVVRSTLPGVNIATQPFVIPPEPPTPIGLETFHTRASALEDTEVLSLSDCDPQPLRVQKSADPTTVEAGGQVTFDVTIVNQSTKDAVIVTSVFDDRIGDIGGNCSPPLPATLGPGQSMVCRVTTSVTGAPESTVTNTVTVSGGYADDGTPVEASASADVAIAAEERTATCNSKVEQGGDTPERIEVDLGGFQGTAAFAWEMYNIKDRMTVEAGGQLIYDTQCVSGSGKKTFEVLPGMNTLTVTVYPNCEGTTGTRWQFDFQCPVQPDASGTPGASGSQSGSSGAASAGTSQSGTTPQPGLPPQPGNQPPPAITPTGRTVAESEPNDSVQAATPTSVGDEINGRIEKTGDADNYRIQLAHPGELTVRFVNAPAELDMAFQVLDQAGAVVRSWQSAPGVGRSFEGTVDIKVPGTYVVEVRDGYNDRASADPYAVVFTFVPVADPSEPNDNLASATPLTWNTLTKASILPVGDADFYAVNLARQGELTVSFPSAPPNLDMAFQVLDLHGAVVRSWQSASAPGKPFSATVDIKTPGPYVIEVRDGYNDARSAQPYEMVATVVETADTGEPNDSLASATPLRLNELVRSNILPVGDADFFAVDLPRQGELTVSFPTAPQNLDMAFQILDPHGAVVRSWQTAPAPGKPFAATVDIKTPGPYVIEVRDGYNDARSAQPYELIVSLSETADAGEPNDNLASATPLPLGAAHQANILPAGDADFYAVDLPQNGSLTVSFPASPPELDMAFQVFDQAGNLVRAWQSAPAPGKSFAASVEIKTPGRYVIEVRDGYNNARSAQPYTLSATLGP